MTAGWMVGWCPKGAISLHQYAEATGSFPQIIFPFFKLFFSSKSSLQKCIYECITAECIIEYKTVVSYCMSVEWRHTLTQIYETGKKNKNLGLISTKFVGRSHYHWVSNSLNLCVEFLCSPHACVAVRQDDCTIELIMGDELTKKFTKLIW